MTVAIRPHHIHNGQAPGNRHGEGPAGGGTAKSTNAHISDTRRQQRRVRLVPTALIVLTVAAAALLWISVSIMTGKVSGSDSGPRKRDGRYGDAPFYGEAELLRRQRQRHRRKSEKADATEDKIAMIGAGVEVERRQRQRQSITREDEATIVADKEVMASGAELLVGSGEGTDTTANANRNGNRRDDALRNSNAFPTVVHLERDDHDAKAATTTALPLRSIHHHRADDDWVNSYKIGTKHKRKIVLSKRARENQQRLKRSEKYGHLRDPLWDGDCVPMQPWQETSFPTCNTIHELDPAGEVRGGGFSKLGSGGYNDIFLFRTGGGDDESKNLVMKVLSYDTKHTDRNFDRVRRDVLIMERLTSSPHVLDVFGHCGFAGLVPHAKGGVLSDEIYKISRRRRHGKKEFPSLRKLTYAAEASRALADLHDIDGEGVSSVTHGDLKSSQYLLFEKDSAPAQFSLRLADFNRGRFLRRNSTALATKGIAAACRYEIGKNDYAFRSPEEYRYEPQTSAIDVWAMGSMLFFLLTGEEAWDDVEIEEANKRIIAGELPKIDEEIKRSGDPVNEALIKAIDLCYVYEPEKRATAEQVATFLRESLEKLTQSLSPDMDFS